MDARDLLALIGNCLKKDNCSALGYLFVPTRAAVEQHFRLLRDTKFVILR
ncbi:MAG TPA: hypothetical protein VH592_05970 [Gemmataceae bacterium]